MTDGSLLFVRYAYPPNALGYCGPDTGGTLLEQAAAGAADEDLRRMVRGFEGAWPYLALIAAANGVADPLDARVVHAYWVGNALLERVGTRALAAHLEERFVTRRTGERLLEPVPEGAVPHHNLHVFGVYPWVGLLRLGHRDEPLRVLDSCRIRWGRVVAADRGWATLRSRGLAWDGRTLSLGPVRQEQARYGQDGSSFLEDLRPGDTVSLHWDWVCDRLSRRSLDALRGYTAATLAAVNRAAHPAPAAVLS